MGDLHPADPPRLATHGTILRWRRVGGLVLAETKYEPDQVIPPHQHPHARFVLVVKGALTEIAGTRPISHTRHALLFRKAHEQHTYRASAQGATCLIVDMDDTWLARAGEHAPVLSRSTALRGGLVLHLAARLHGEFGLRDEVSRLAIESLALGVLAEASRRVAREQRENSPAWLPEARAFVDAHFAERLALATVAAIVGVHPVHLARTFRRTYNTTFAAYVRATRVEFARRQLIATRAPLSDIAMAAGFCDQSHFSRLFKLHTGLSPQEYRLAACRA